VLVLCHRIVLMGRVSASVSQDCVNGQGMCYYFVTGLC